MTVDLARCWAAIRQIAICVLETLDVTLILTGDALDVLDDHTKIELSNRNSSGVKVRSKGEVVYIIQRRHRFIAAGPRNGMGA